MSSMEEAIWSTESSQPRVESVRDRIAVVQPIPEDFYERCAAHSIVHCMLCRMKSRVAAAATPQQGEAQPILEAGSAVEPAQSATALLPEPHVPEVVRMAHDLADAITACTKLKQKIIGLEAALDFARSELGTAEVTKADAQSALRKLVEEEQSLN